MNRRSSTLHGKGHIGPNIHVVVTYKNPTEKKKSIPETWLNAKKMQNPHFSELSTCCF